MRIPAHLILFFISVLYLFTVGATKSLAQLPPKGESLQRMPDESIVYPTGYLPDHPYPGYEPRPPVAPFLGENHAYTVTFRGNGEAVVVGRFTFTNTGNKKQQFYRLRVPKADLDDVRVFQQIRRGGCIRYDYPQPILPRYGTQESETFEPNPEPCFSYTNQTDCETNAYNVAPKCYWRPDAADSCRSNPIPSPIVYRKPICTQYQQIDYYDSYWSGTTDYNELNYDQFGDEIEITLSQPLAPKRSTSIIMYYRAFGYTKKTFPGTFRYAFETLQTSNTIQNLTVAVETDSDLYLKGVKGKTNYRIEEGIAMLKSPSMAADSAMGTRFNSYYQNIGQGSLQKTTGNLQAGDSYTVTGVYADAVYKLYLKETAVGILVAIAVIALLILIVRFIIRRFRQMSVTGVRRTKTAAVSSQHHDTHMNLLLTLGISFASSLVIFITIVALIFLGSQTQMLLSRLYYLDYWMVESLFKLIFILLFVLIDLIVFLSPVVYMWKKKGTQWGIATLVAIILWLIVYLILALFIVLIFNQTRYYPSPGYPVELMR